MCGFFKRSNSLTWDIWDSSELLACLVKELSGSINLVCGDLAKCQLGDRGCQSGDGRFFRANNQAGGFCGLSEAVLPRMVDAYVRKVGFSSRFVFVRFAIVLAGGEADRNLDKRQRVPWLDVL